VLFRVEGRPAVLIERKTASDLVSSIFGGNHFGEQLFRMLEVRRENPHCLLVLLLEGDLANNFHWKQQQQSRAHHMRAHVNSILFDLPHIYQIHIHRTADLNASLLYLSELEERLGERGALANILEDSTYLEEYFVGRKRQLTASEFSTAALMQISGVSEEIARQIVKSYGSLVELGNAYAALPPKQAKRLLAEFRHGATQRRVGTKLSERIYTYVMSSASE
jgi:ERCC4-type nuclease